MKCFKDANGREWAVEINVGQAKRVRASLQVDLPALVAGRADGLGELLDDPIRLVDVLYVLCRDQAQKAGISDEQFGCGLGGDTLAQATDALVESLVDFFPDPKRREVLRKLMAAARSIQAATLTELTERLDADPKFLLVASSGSSGVPPEFSASTPTPSP